MAYQVGETFFQNWRKVLARSRNQCTQSSRVRRYNKGKKGWQKGRETICEAAAQGGKENSGVQVMAEKWIQKAIKKPGALRAELGVKGDKPIPAKKLAAAAKKPGKLGQRARLAQTLKKMK